MCVARALLSAHMQKGCALQCRAARLQGVCLCSVCWLLQLTSHAAWSDRPRPTRRPLGHEARHGRPRTTRHGPCAARAAWP